MDAAPARATPLDLLPGRGEIRASRCGVVGIVSPWNYPVQLALAPVVGALAAGNRVLVKPSEITPATSALLAEPRRGGFPEDEFAVVQGDADAWPHASRGCPGTTCSSPARRGRAAA